jgi:hypothetical protein
MRGVLVMASLTAEQRVELAWRCKWARTPRSATEATIDNVFVRVEWMEALLADLAAAEAERDALRETAERFGAHMADCDTKGDALDRVTVERDRLLDALRGTVAQVEHQRQRAERAEARVAALEAAHG